MAAPVGTRPSRISPLLYRPCLRRTGIRLPKSRTTATVSEVRHAQSIPDKASYSTSRVQLARWEQGPDALPPLVRDTPVTAGLSRGCQASERLLQERMFPHRIR